jgi:hypothetical protein
MQIPYIFLPDLP